MDRREIEVFVTVMQLGSVSAAARALEMAQPSVSKAIALIERRHGITLFERRRGRLHPTEAASQLVGEATRMGEELSRFDRYVDGIRQMRPGVIRIAATPSLSLGLLPLATRRLFEVFGPRGLILDMHPNHDVTAAVERREYDLGLFVHAGTDVPPRTIPLAEGRIVCAFPSGDTFARLDAVGAGDLEGRDLVAITTDMGIVAMLARSVPGFGRRSPRSIETNRYNIALNLVRAGLGVTLIDEFTMFGQGADVDWRPFEPALDVTLLAVAADGRDGEGRTAAFLRTIRDLLGGG